jgi:hypothetical protein
MQYALFESANVIETRWNEKQASRAKHIRERIAFHRHAQMRLYRKLNEIEGTAPPA